MIADRLAARRPRLSVGFVLAHEFTLSTFSLFLDQLRLAADDDDRSRPINCAWSILAEKPTPIRSSCGIAISRTSPWVDPRAFDYIVVAGGLLGQGEQIEDGAADFLRQAAYAGVPLIGLCTGSFVLCRAGLMRGRTTCVSWFHYRDFIEEFPDQAVIADQLFLIDGDRITCSGGTGAADLANELIQRHLNDGFAMKARKVMLIDQIRTGRSPQPHPPLQQVASAKDSRIRQALLLMEQHIAKPILVAHLAKKIGISARQIERLFQDELGISPAAAYLSLRLDHANWLLEHSELSVSNIAIDTGFVDSAHLSRRFKQRYFASPSAIRKGARVSARGA